MRDEADQEDSVVWQSIEGIGRYDAMVGEQGVRA